MPEETLDAVKNLLAELSRERHNHAMVSATLHAKMESFGEQIDDLKVQVKEISHTLRGNGAPGFGERMRLSEHKIESIEEDIKGQKKRQDEISSESRKGKWGVVIALASALGAAVVAGFK